MSEAVERYVKDTYGRARRPGAEEERDTPPGRPAGAGAGDTPDTAAAARAYLADTYARDEAGRDTPPRDGGGA